VEEILKEEDTVVEAEVAVVVIVLPRSNLPKIMDLEIFRFNGTNTI
jgi:hypothetical protein